MFITVNVSQICCLCYKVQTVGGAKNRCSGKYNTGFITIFLRCIIAKNYPNRPWIDKVIAKIKRVPKIMLPFYFCDYTVICWLILIRVRTIVTIGLSLRPIVALSDDYRSEYFFTDCCTDSATGCRAQLWLIYDIHSEVVSTAMLLLSELLNCDSMLA